MAARPVSAPAKKKPIKAPPALPQRRYLGVSAGGTATTSNFERKSEYENIGAQLLQERIEGVHQQPNVNTRESSFGQARLVQQQLASGGGLQSTPSQYVMSKPAHQKEIDEIRLRETAPTVGSAPINKVGLILMVTRLISLVHVAS